jgi:hypothetical protein
MKKSKLGVRRGGRRRRSRTRRSGKEEGALWFKNKK